jgi:hypothetical protein
MSLATQNPSLDPSDALILLMTVESLLFAALAVAVTLAGPSELGGPPFVRGAKLAWSITGVLTVISLGALMCWLELYGGSNWPCGFRATLTALAILVGIAAQPLIATLIARGID